MGWWNAGRDGSSLHEKPTGLIWGDGPADIIDQAIDEIISVFRRDWNRDPTLQEMKSGILFSIGRQTPMEWEEWLMDSKPWVREGLPYVNSSTPGLLNAIPRRQSPRA